MKSELFQFKTQLNADASDVFEWHKRPGAFEALSPPWMDVKVLERSGGIRDGGKVALEVSCGPVKLRWKLEHRNYVEGKQFQDVQIAGPFDKWTHTHSFQDTNGGCVLEDSIEFRMPWMTVPGLPVAQVFMSELQRMFNYRQDVLANQISLATNTRETMKIAVSGSHGLVGSALTPLLTIQGNQVRRMIRQTGEVFEPDIAWNPALDWDGRAALDGVDAVIHLAGENIASRWNAEKKREIRDSRINATRALSESLATMKNPPKTFICASAIGYYGDRGDEILDETSTAGTGFLSDLAADWENATSAARDAGIRVINLRLGIVLSPRGGALAKMLPPFQMGAGGLVGSGKQYMSWIAIDDVAGAILHCLADHNISGPVNIVAPNAVTNEQYTRALGAVLHRPTFCPVPEFGARLAFGEMADALLLSSTRVAPNKLLDSGYRFMYPDIEVALHHVLGK